MLVVPEGLLCYFLYCYYAFGGRIAQTVTNMNKWLTCATKH